MIASSQISLLQTSARQTSTLDAQSLHVRQQPGQVRQQLQAGEAERSLFRQATYRYSSQEQLAFSNTSEVRGDHRAKSLSSAQLVEQTADLLLMGQQALTVSRAAMGGEVVAEPKASVELAAGKYLFYSENESRSFTSSGRIRLESGEKIDFTLSLRQSQSRSYEYSELVQIRERPMTDPLVINFGDSSVRLTDTLFEFDLNGDGQTGKFASLGSGSGYLVFDRNGNGQVDDGSELFGPTSGSGFSELAAFDDDGNRWVDANDAVFSQLSVWVQTAESGKQLRSLEDVGVQALFVDSADGRFTLTNPQGVPLGQIKASGIYLTTDGQVRTLEELDLAEQNTQPAPQVDVPLEVQAGSGSSVAPSQGNGLVDGQIEGIQKALEKLQDIRRQQQEFVDASRARVEEKSPLDDYMKLIDKLRLALIIGQSEKKQAADQYRSLSDL